MRRATDYYAVLGVEPEASAEDIRAAFRQLAREHHPDATGGDPVSEQRYKEISEAYAVLSDPQKRQEYDQARLGFGTWSSPWGSPFASTIEEIFETFFGGGGGFGGRAREQTRAQHGESIEVAVELTLEEVVFGAERSLRFERYEPCERCDAKGAEPGTEPQRCDRCAGTGQVQEARRTIIGSIVTSYPCRECRASGWIVKDPCNDCRGAGRLSADVEVPVEVPPGIAEGDRMRLSGEGEAGSAGGGRGDLYVRFHVAPDERFERAGDDLFTWAEIPMTAAALGGEMSIASLDGEETIEIPAGTQSDSLFRVKGKGVPRRAGRGRGDLIVRTHVTTPRKISKKEKEALRELASLRGEDPKGRITVAPRRALDRRD
jgi:molecular chaperone DnaJ